MKNTMIAGALISSISLATFAFGQNYVVHLVRNLLKIGYPLKPDDVIALDKMGMGFDSKNRVTVLEKILKDRDTIHGRKDIDYFTRTEVICDALRLLDELDLPIAYKLIGELNRQMGWEEREKALLSYMAAKRDIHYQENVAYLLYILPQYGRGSEMIYGEQTFREIIDVINCLSYLADLFARKGDNNIMNTLILYVSTAYGFPAEYLSHMFVDMFLMQPKVFVSALASKDDRTIHIVTDALIFGIRNDELKEKVKNILHKDLSSPEESNKYVVTILKDKADIR